MSAFGFTAVLQLPTLWEIIQKIATDPKSAVGWEQLAQHRGETEVSHARQEEWPDVFDYRLDDEFRTTKARKYDRPLHTVRRLCVHQMAIQFGTSKSQRTEWRSRLMLGTAPKPLQRLLGPADVNLDALAQRAALHWRMRAQVPYHDKALLNGDVILSERATRYTHHGNGANAESIGLGLEGHFPGLVKDYKPGTYHDLDAFTIETFRAAMRLSVTKRREEGCPITEVEHHRQHSAQRLGDAGEGIHKEVVIPMAKELNLRIAYERTTGSGKVITSDWDPVSPFDSNGKLRL